MQVLGKKVKIGVLKQADWATPGGAATAFKTLNYDKDVTIPDPAVDVSEFDYTSATSIFAEENRMHVNSKTGLKKLNFSGNANKNLLAQHFSAFFHNQTEAGTTPYPKTYVIESDSPNFYGDKGYLHTLAFSALNAIDDTKADGMLLKNAILDELNLTYNPSGQGKDNLLKYSGTWVGRELQNDVDFTGTWVAMPTAGLLSNFVLTALTIGSTDLANVCLKMAEVNFKNNVSIECIGSDGYANNYRIAPEINVTLDIPYNETSLATLSAYKAGSNVLFTLRNGDPSLDGNLQIACTKGILTDNPFVYENEYVALRLKIKILKPVAGWSAIVSFADGIDQNY